MQTDVGRRGEAHPSRGSITPLASAAQRPVSRSRNSGNNADGANGMRHQSARTDFTLWRRLLSELCQHRSGVLAIPLACAQAVGRGIKTAGTRLQTPSVCSSRLLPLPPLPPSHPVLHREPRSVLLIVDGVLHAPVSTSVFFARALC